MTVSVHVEESELELVILRHGRWDRDHGVLLKRQGDMDGIC